MRKLLMSLCVGLAIVTSALTQDISSPNNALAQLGAQSGQMANADFNKISSCKRKRCYC